MVKISLCTVCHKRLYHLLETLPNNLRHLDSNCELVILDYGDDNLKDSIANFNDPRLTYAKHQTDRYHACHSKNASVMASSGEFVISLDADYFIGPNFIPTLRNKIKQNSFYNVKGLYGMLGFWREDFIKMGGYDETSFADGYWGYNDDDLRDRAIAAGLQSINLEIQGIKTIEHSNSERVENTGQTESFVKTYVKHKKISLANIKNGELIANKGKPFGAISQ